ncbi:MAG: cytochrome c oxidase subunit I [Acidimicrobiales bacterium]
MTTFAEPSPATPPGTVTSAVEDDDAIEEIWEDDPGVPGFFATVDHKRIGMRYIYTSFAFFFVAGAMALVMRAQLAQSNGHVLGPGAYNQLFTAHGTTMIFLFNTPVLAGFGNYLLPLMLGGRDMAFPRLNAFSYWVFLFSGIFIYLGFLIGQAPNGGWFAYVPLTGAKYSPGHNIDFWGLGVIFVGISTTVGAINFLVTALKLRCPGMSVRRLPIFVWSMIGFSLMVLFAVPALTVAAALLEGDRLFGTQFFVPEKGGSALLYQHLFWFWGHPEVYILFLPATGMVSTMLPVQARRRLSGYLWVAASLVAIAFISFGVWVHHMFATGQPELAMAYFSAASLVIAIPSGVLFFAWIATLWGGRVRFDTPMLFCIGFLVIFLLGGLTGVMVAVMPFDWQVTDSYFIVAHFHYVLNGAVVFPIFGALYYWLPKMTGRMLDERLGKVSFWTMLIGFNASFFPMHVLGLLGMPRRIYTYHSGLGWDGLNALVSVGGAVFGLGTAMTLVNMAWSHFRGAQAPPNPWEADTLEWATTSPPPDQNFTVTPVVHSRHPLWDDDPPLDVETPGIAPGSHPAFGREGARDHQAAISEGIESRPDHGTDVPQPTYVPFWVAAGMAVFFLGLLVKASVVLAAGLIVGVVVLLIWTWRTEADLR